MQQSVEEQLVGERFWVVFRPANATSSQDIQSTTYKDFAKACQAVARMNQRGMNPEMIVERTYSRVEYSNVSATCHMRLRHGGVSQPTLGLKRHFGDV